MKLQLCFPCNMPFQISQRWGENRDYYYTNFKENGHNGWDFAIPIGTPIYATHDGYVFFTGTDSTGAISISIDSTDKFDYKGGQSQFRTIYGHLSVLKVTENQIVKKGDLIALSGNTGRYTTGPHLHFGIHPIANFQDTEKDNGMNGAVDPALFLDGTYPNSPKVAQPGAVPTKPSNTIFLAMQQAILNFQLSEGILDYKNAPLKDINYGDKTKLATKKYK
jgi:murein DD-endopeptidase MepM/ murein hydrolase activator NlpD